MSSRVALDFRDGEDGLSINPEPSKKLSNPKANSILDTLSVVYFVLFLSLVNASLLVVFTNASLCVLIDTDKLMLCYEI